MELVVRLPMEQHAAPIAYTMPLRGNTAAPMAKDLARMERLVLVAAVERLPQLRRLQLYRPQHLL